MSIEISDGLAKLFSGLTGMQWPQADEDKLRAAGDDYLIVSNDMPKLEEYLVELANACRAQFDGQAAQAFVQTIDQLTGRSSDTDSLAAVSKQAADLAKTAHDTANQVEYAKWMTIAQLIQLLAEIAWAVAWAPFTGGASLGEIVAERLIAEGIIRKIFAWLLDKIAMHTFMSIVGGVGLDAIIQMVQIAEGHKSWSDWDTKSTLQALEFGALNGLIGGPLDLLGGALGKFFKNAIGKSLGKDALETAFKGLSNGLAKDGLKTLSSDALKAAENDLLKTVEKDGLKTVGKDGIRTVSNDAAKTVGKDGAKAAEGSAAREAGQTAGREAGQSAEKATEAAAEKSAAAEKAALAEAQKTAASVENVISEGLSRVTRDGEALLEKEVAQKFGAELGRTIGSFSHEFGTHFMATAEKLDAAALAKFEGEMGKVFQEHLSGLLGKEEAQQLGKDFGKVLAMSERSSEKGLSNLQGGMKGVFEKAGVQGDAIDTLVKQVPGLLDKVGSDTMLFKLGAALGDYLKSGVHNSLTEGFYNLTFGDDHTFSLTWQTFVSGIGMGALGHGVHKVVDHTFGKKYVDWAKGYLENQNKDSEDRFYGPLHPLTLISLLGNLSGHSAPFPVPRPKAAQDRADEADARRSALTSDRPRTESTGSEEELPGYTPERPPVYSASSSTDTPPPYSAVRTESSGSTHSTHSTHSSGEEQLGAPEERSTVSQGAGRSSRSRLRSRLPTSRRRPPSGATSPPRRGRG